ncbi:unnamed protein product [Haemonchus placei]|uniref:DUF4258 domain-containing protein n=1 Tax=Haemonchus placei TaxID=6290 RepID=A0A0N4VXY7_HAEPC|nr:unnamed protein product [Haemonchus placei]
MARVTRRVLQMSDRELEAVIAVAMPGRRVEGMRRDELQEICMKWLFANGLSINHQFTIDHEGDEIYVLMSNKSSCTCCQKGEVA